MYHEELYEWMHLNKIRRADMAEIIGVTGATLSPYFLTGKSFRGEWIVAWQKAYGWSDEQMFHFAFDRAFKPNPELFKTEEEERALKALSGLKEALRVV